MKAEASNGIGRANLPVIRAAASEANTAPAEPQDSRDSQTLMSRLQDIEKQFASHVLHLHHNRHGVSEDQQLAGDIAYQRRKRLITYGSMMFGDATALATIGVDFGMLPCPSGLVLPLNLVNALTGAIGIAQNLSAVRDALTTPDATPQQKRMEKLELASNIFNTAGSMVPTLLGITGTIAPLSAVGIAFAGPQIISSIGDIAKAIYDKKQGGTQSGHADGDQPHKLVMDHFEKLMGRNSVLAGTLGAQATAFPHSAIGALLPAVLVPTLTSFGGAIGGVYAFTQVKKSKQFLELLKDAKAHGIDEFRLPDASGKPQEIDGQPARGRVLRTDDVIAELNRRKWGGYGQMAASALLVAAGCTAGMPLAAPLAMAGLGLSVAVAMAAVTAEVIAHRHEIADGAKKLVAAAGEKVVAAGQKVVGLVRRNNKAEDVPPSDTELNRIATALETSEQPQLEAGQAAAAN